MIAMILVGLCANPMFAHFGFYDEGDYCLMGKINTVSDIIIGDIVVMSYIGKQQFNTLEDLGVPYTLEYKSVVLPIVSLKGGIKSSRGQGVTPTLLTSLEFMI